MRLFLVLITFLANFVMAAHVAVLETVAEENAKDSVSQTDRRYLTNILREQAVRELPVEQNYVIMTRDNISVMLPPGMVLEECEGSCLAETGRNIAADFICQARIGKFGGMLTLSAELYETAGNKLIASFNGRGANVNELLVLIEQKSPEFFHRVRDLAEPAPVTENDAIPENGESIDSVTTDVKKTVAEEKSQENDAVKSRAQTAYDELDGKETKVGESVPANVENEKSSTTRWMVLGLGSVVAVTGAVLAVVGDNKAKDAATTEKFANQDEFNDARDEAKSGQTLRSVGIGLAIVGAVGIGISFAF